MSSLKGSLEDNVLTLLCSSDQHAPGLVLHLKTELFSTRQYRKIADTAFRHIEQYGRAPGAHLRDILEADLMRGEEGLLLKRIIDDIDALAPELQPEYVLSKLSEFIALRKIAIAVEAAADAVQAGDVEAAQQALYQRDLGANLSPGIWMSDPDALLAFLNEKEDDHFTSGIETLDRRGIRPARGQVLLWLGSKKIGKSWALLQCGRLNMMSRRSVLYLTLEMSEDEISKRFVQSLFAMTATKSETIRVPVFKKDPLGRCAAIDFDVLTPEMIELRIRPQLIKRLKTFKSKPRFLIKSFPMSSLTIPMLNAYLDSLERTDNFKPDLLIIDYAKIMALDPKQLRISAGHTMEQLKGIAGIRDMAVVTAWQGNRQTEGAKTVTSGMISEDWSLAGTVDNLVTISRTAAEKQHGLARLLVDASRHAEDKWTAMISQSYATGQFCIDSVYMSKYVEEEVGRLSGEDAADAEE